MGRNYFNTIPLLVLLSGKSGQVSVGQLAGVVDWNAECLKSNVVVIRVYKRLFREIG